MTSTISRKIKINYMIFVSADTFLIIRHITETAKEVWSLVSGSPTKGTMFDVPISLSERVSMSLSKGAVVSLSPVQL